MPAAGLAQNELIESAQGGAAQKGNIEPGFGLFAIPAAGPGLLFLVNGDVGAEVGGGGGGEGGAN